MLAISTVAARSWSDLGIILCSLLCYLSVGLSENVANAFYDKVRYELSGIARFLNLCLSRGGSALPVQFVLEDFVGIMDGDSIACSFISARPPKFHWVVKKHTRHQPEHVAIRRNAIGPEKDVYFVVFPVI